MKTETPATLKADTNRANAQKSTGPTTPAGKAISAQNAVTHGLTLQNSAHFPAPIRRAFLKFRAALFLEYAPQTNSEVIVLEDYILSAFQRQRAQSMAIKAMEDALANPAIEDLLRRAERLRRYVNSLARQADTALKRLRLLQIDRFIAHEKTTFEGIELPPGFPVTSVYPKGQIENLMSICHLRL